MLYEYKRRCNCDVLPVIIRIMLLQTKSEFYTLHTRISEFKAGNMDLMG